MDQNAAYAFAKQGLQSAVETQSVAPARTIATAISGLDKLNERLANIRAGLSHLCEAIGGPYPASGQIKGDRPPISGAVGRLNESTDAAHSILSEIEELLSTASRSLG